MTLITSSDDWWHVLVIRLYYKFLPRKFLLLISKYMYVQTLLFHWKANMRTFPFDQNSGLNYWKFPVANGMACSRILRKGDNFIRYSQTLKNVLPGVPFDSFPLFLHLNFRNFPRTIRVLEICNFRNFRLDLLLAFGSRFHEHPAGMLREKLSWYTLKLLKSSNSKLLIGKGCSLPK